MASPRARNKIRQWFSRERREDAMETGREELIKALRREGLPVQKLAASNALERLAAAMNYVDLDSLHASIGDGHVSARSVAQRLARDLRGGGGEEQLPTTVGPGLRTRTRRGSPVGVYVEGLDDVMVRLSRCCTPVPGDQIVGFVTRGRGVSVHRADCANATALAAGGEERLIEVEWDREGTTVFVASVEVLAFDRSRLLSDVTRVVSEHHLNIVSSSSQTAARPGQPDELRRGAGRPRAPGVAHQLAQAPRRRLRRLPHPSRPEGLSPRWAIGSGAAPRPGGHPRRAVARVGALGAARGASSPDAPSGAGFGLVLNPMFEDAQLFRRGIGDESDVVRKEMYEFDDRGGREVALRPEGTASVVRAFVQHHPPVPWKAWYVTPAFRYERPQAGRYKQHHQLGVEVLGTDDPDVDVEVITLAADLYRWLGLRQVDLALNSMGCGRVPARLRGRARGLPRGARRRAVRRAPGALPGRTRCGCSTASGPSAGP